MLLVEGCDRVGKTTVARELCRRLVRHSYVHQTKPPMQAFAYFGRTIFTSHPCLVLDRMHLSDLAYRNAYREDVELSAHEWRLIELALLSHRCHVLYLTDSIEGIRSRYGPTEMWPKEGVERVWHQYEALWHRQSVPHQTHLDVTRATLRDLITAEGAGTDLLSSLITAEIEVSYSRPAALAPTHGLGHVDGGGFMLIGEAPSEVEYNGHLAPRLPWDRGPASEWLWAALDAAQIEWWCGYYTNASAFYTASDFYEYCRDVVKPIVVVALGNTAYDLCREAFDLYAPTTSTHPWQPLQLSKLGHPQHERRFKRGQFLEYALAFQRNLGAWAPKGGGLTTNAQIEAVTHHNESPAKEETT